MIFQAYLFAQNLPSNATHHVSNRPMHNVLANFSHRVRNAWKKNKLGIKRVGLTRAAPSRGFLLGLHTVLPDHGTLIHLLNFDIQSADPFNQIWMSSCLRGYNSGAPQLQQSAE